MRKDENFVDYGKYLNSSIPRFWRILQEDRTNGVKMTWHHAFNGNLKQGAWQKRRLSKNGLEAEYEEYELDMDEGVYLAPAIHCVLNVLLGNHTPPVIFANLNYIFETKFIDRYTKEYFTKFVLYIVQEKFEQRIKNREYRSLDKINEFVEDISRKSIIIHMDVNDGNKKDAEYIMFLFKVTRNEMVHFLIKNFLPKDWIKYPEELWGLSL